MTDTEYIDFDERDSKPKRTPPNKGEVRYCANPSCGKELVYNEVRKKTPKRYCNMDCNRAAARATAPIDRPIPTPNVPFTDREWEILKALAHSHCTSTEAARYLGINRSTLCDRLRAQRDADHPNGWTWTEFAEEFQAKARASIRMKMYETAMADDSKMSGVMRIFLAKNWLGMGDRTTVAHEQSAEKPKSVEEVDAALAEVFSKYNIGDGQKAQ